MMLLTGAGPNPLTPLARPPARPARGAGIRRAIASTITSMATGATFGELGAPGQVARTAWSSLPTETRDQVAGRTVGQLGDGQLALLAVGGLLLVYVIKRALEG